MAGKIQARSADGRVLMHVASGKIMSECCCESCELSLSTGPQFRFYPGQLFGETKSVTLLNTGSNSVVWTSALSGDAEAIDYTTIDPSSGSLNPSISEILDVEVDPAGNLVVNGTYDGVLTAEGNDGGCDATADITVMVAALYSGNIKFVMDRQFGGPFNQTYVYLSPGVWRYQEGSGFQWYLYIDANGARARARNSVGVWGTYSPYFDIALRYSDGYPSGESVQWNGFPATGAWLQVDIGPDVW